MRMRDQITKQPEFHGNISRDEAKRYLTGHPEEYLIRFSKRKPITIFGEHQRYSSVKTNIVISFCWPNGDIKHTIFYIDGESIKFTKKNGAIVVFDNLPEFIDKFLGPNYSPLTDRPEAATNREPEEAPAAEIAPRPTARMKSLYI